MAGFGAFGVMGWVMMESFGLGFGGRNLAQECGGEGGPGALETDVDRAAGQPERTDLHVVSLASPEPVRSSASRRSRLQSAWYSPGP